MGKELQFEITRSLKIIENVKNEMSKYETLMKENRSASRTSDEKTKQLKVSESEELASIAQLRSFATNPTTSVNIHKPKKIEKTIRQ